MAKTITVIPSTINPLTRLARTDIRKRRTAGYARVSTDSDEQFTSYEAQIDYYTKYITSHQDWGIKKFCAKVKPTSEDIIVLLGDVGANYYDDERDDIVKRALAKLKPAILCIHGNHEIRPWNIEGYRQKEWNGGKVWFQEQYPTLLFAADGEIFTLNGLRYLVIGGAYSVDKFLRLRSGGGWWPDEQPSSETKAFVERQIQEHTIDVVLSHTCPFRYEPIEMFLPMVDQSTVDASTEHWLDNIEQSLSYKAWYCGHWHTDKRIDKFHFLYHSFESDEWLHPETEVFYEE